MIKIIISTFIILLFFSLALILKMLFKRGDPVSGSCTPDSSREKGEACSSCSCHLEGKRSC
ncbi:MAG: hypothetical protein GY754_13735 [bacterium]|nr:hypothetical protein [bacterium]